MFERESERERERERKKVSHERKRLLGSEPCGDTSEHFFSSRETEANRESAKLEKQNLSRIKKIAAATKVSRAVMGLGSGLRTQA